MVSEGLVSKSLSVRGPQHAYRRGLDARSLTQLGALPQVEEALDPNFPQVMVEEVDASVLQRTLKGDDVRPVPAKKRKAKREGEKKKRFTEPGCPRRPRSGYVIFIEERRPEVHAA
jgi:hypothetical protein